jgi:hypothetical protein
MDKKKTEEGIVITEKNKDILKAVDEHKKYLKEKETAERIAKKFGLKK